MSTPPHRKATSSTSTSFRQVHTLCMVLRPLLQPQQLPYRLAHAAAICPPPATPSHTRTNKPKSNSANPHPPFHRQRSHPPAPPRCLAPVVHFPQAPAPPVGRHPWHGTAPTPPAQTAAVLPRARSVRCSGIVRRESRLRCKCLRRAANRRDGFTRLLCAWPAREGLPLPTFPKNNAGTVTPGHGRTQQHVDRAVDRSTKGFSVILAGSALSQRSQSTQKKFNSAQPRPSVDACGACFSPSPAAILAGPAKGPFVPHCCWGSLGRSQVCSPRASV